MRWVGFFASASIALAVLSAAALGEAHFAVAFRDIAQAAGLTSVNVYGGLSSKAYILETTGNGVAIFDYDGDGREDLLIANGTRLEAGANDRGRPQLYHNEGNGHFRDVSEKAGFADGGWGEGVCVGDFDNDGYPDLLLTAYGHNRLYRNRGDGTFEDVTEKAHLPVTGIRFGSGCSFLDYDRDGYLDLFVANYVDLDLATTPHPGTSDNVPMEGHRGNVRTSRLAARPQYSLPQ